MTVPLISVVVLGFKNFDRTTRPCLESLTPWLDDPEVEFLVVDNGSPDGSGHSTREWCLNHPPVQFLPSEHNRGYAGGMNWGASHAKGQWLLLVNNDTVFPAHTLDALKQVLLNAPSDVAMVGPVTNAAGNGQRLWKPEASHAEWLHIGARLNTHPTRQLMPTYRCDFFCIAIRRDAWLKLGGLDLAFGLGYYEDFDFSLRLRAAGYQQVITEDVFILHVGSATFQGNAAARALIKRNKRLLMAKHPSARFEHTRLGNLTVLRAYGALSADQLASQAVQMRLQLRVPALAGDVPRSPLKRLWWRWRVRSLAGRWPDC